MYLLKMKKHYKDGQYDERTIYCRNFEIVDGKSSADDFYYRIDYDDAAYEVIWRQSYDSVNIFCVD